MSDNTHNMQWEYNGAAIRLDDKSKRFVVVYDDEDTGRGHDTWAQAAAAIDARQEREARANRIKIAVPVIERSTREGGGVTLSRHVITGVHGGHGGYMAKPPLDKYGSGPLYLDHPTVLALLEKLAAAEAAVQAVNSDLAQFELSTGNYAREKAELTTAQGIESWRAKKTAEADASQAPA